MIADCPLCGADQTQPFHQDKRRSYFRCEICALVFVAAKDRPTSAQEKAIYDLHQNQLDDLGYRRFLMRFATPFLQYLPSNSLSGLDFGCGPGPLLAEILKNGGHEMALYDPFYAPDLSVFSARYDFVTCTEAIEHFHQPMHEWAQLIRLLKPQGILGIMTKLVIDAEAFSRWHYKNDLTHVSFFSRETFGFLAQRDGFEVEFPANDVILLRKISK